ISGPIVRLFATPVASPNDCTSHRQGDSEHEKDQPANLLSIRSQNNCHQGGVDNVHRQDRRGMLIESFYLRGVNPISDENSLHVASLCFLTEGSNYALTLKRGAGSAVPP